MAASVEYWKKDYPENVDPVKEMHVDTGKGIIVKDSTEPIYGDQYPPKKFKMAVTVPTDNSLDLYINDIGVVVITDPKKGGEVEGFNLTVGGGLGRTHKKEAIFARAADHLGYVPKDKLMETLKAILATYRDYGNREVRSNARLKYLVHKLGIDKYRDLVHTYLPEVICSSSERCFLLVCSPKPTADCDVEAFDLASFFRVRDDHHANVVDVEVQGVVRRDRDRHLELLWEILIPIDGLDWVVRDDSFTSIDMHCSDRIHAFRVVLLPIFDARGLLAIEPDLAEGRGLRLEEISHGEGPLFRVAVLGAQHRIDRRRWQHHVPADVAAPRDRRRTKVHDSADDGFQILLEDSVDLESLPSRDSQVVLAILLAEVIQKLVEVGGDESPRHFQTEHELIRLLSLDFAVRLDVRPVVL